MRIISASLLVTGLGAAALAQDLPNGIGVVTPSGSVFTTEITAPLDTDDYVFQGYPGMVVSVTVKAVKHSTLSPSIQIIRPDGSIIGEGNRLSFHTTPTSATAKATLDVTGWWKVRVLGVVLTRDPIYHNPVTRSAGGYTVSVRYSLSSVPPLPLPSRSFHGLAQIAEQGEVDSYPFQGYDGQSFAAKLTVPKSSSLEPAMRLIRPDGEVAATVGIGTDEKVLSLDQPLDASGTWQLRVIGEETTPGDTDHSDATTGAYSLNVKLGRATAVGLTPDANNQYRLTIPAAAKARIGWKLNFEGPAPTFNSLFDPLGRQVFGVTGGLAVRGYLLGSEMPFGDYVVTFNAPSGTKPTNVTFVRTVLLAKGEKKRVAKLSAKEPVIFSDQSNGIVPTAGGPGTNIAVTANNLVDEFAPDGEFRIELDHIALENVSGLQGQSNRTVAGDVPASLPEGVFDVTIFSSSGQPGSRAAAFTRVPPPVVTGIDPVVGPDTGHFDVTITGSNFREGQMSILLDDFVQPIIAKEVTDDHITFEAPARAPGTYTFGVKDKGTQLSDDLPLNSFEYVASAAISRIVPALIPVLGNEVVTIQGAHFAADDRVYLETSTGGFEEITATQTTFDVNRKLHVFTAPTRPKGVYRVYVQNSLGQPNPPKYRNLTYYSFADATAASNLGSLGSDKYDAWTSAIGDYDHDADKAQDLFVARRGSGGAAATSQLRVLHNDGAGAFTDVTASVMPEAGDDDWRADRLWVTDVNQDGFVDIVITTNSTAVPAADMSHTRLLVNEKRGGGGVGQDDRVFRDRTIDLMAPPRQMQRYGVFGGNAEFYVSDNWRGLDMWVGDIDKGASGPPEIVITHDEVTNDDNPNADVFQSGVYCGNYCSSVQTFAYSYTFYWGGSRLFVWDKSKRSGLGQYKFDPNFFPRISGPVVPQGGIPGGGTIQACSPHYNSICKGAFTPFVGKRLAVGVIDSDGKPDVAVISDQAVTRLLEPHVPESTPLVAISSLQVGLNKPSAGFGLTDVTDLIGGVGGNTTGDAIAIGQPGFPDGNSFGVIAFTHNVSSFGGPVLRMFKWAPAVPANAKGTFEDVSPQVLPAVDANDTFQASRLAFLDIDQDGDQDLALLANAPPGGTQTAFRVFRNERVGTNVGVFRRTLDPLLQGIVTASEHFEGEALAIGDVTGDGTLDFVVSRAVVSGGGSQTRIVKIDKEKP